MKSTEYPFYMIPMDFSLIFTYTRAWISPRLTLWMALCMHAEIFLRVFSHILPYIHILFYGAARGTSSAPWIVKIPALLFHASTRAFIHLKFSHLAESFKTTTERVKIISTGWAKTFDTAVSGEQEVEEAHNSGALPRPVDVNSPQSTPSRTRATDTVCTYGLYRYAPLRLWVDCLG